MKKSGLAIKLVGLGVLVLAVLLLSILGGQNNDSESVSVDPGTCEQKVEFSEQETEDVQVSYCADIVQTQAARAQGLSGRQSLADNSAMLFIFETDRQHGIWMKDMLFDIDIVWLNSDFEVIYVERSVSPDSYPITYKPTSDARYVVEINAGQAEQFGIGSGSVAVVKGFEI